MKLKCFLHFQRKKLPKKYLKWWQDMTDTIPSCDQCGMGNITLDGLEGTIP